MELMIFPVSARQFGIKDMLDGHAGVENFLGGIVWEVTRDEWYEAYFVTLIDRCSFLCVSGQRGTIAKAMHEEHLSVYRSPDK